MISVSLHHPLQAPTPIPGFEPAIDLSAEAPITETGTGTGISPRMLREDVTGIVLDQGIVPDQGTDRKARTRIGIKIVIATGARVTTPRLRRASGVVAPQAPLGREIGRGPRSPSIVAGLRRVPRAHLVLVPDPTHLTEAERRRSATRRVASADFSFDQFLSSHVVVPE